MTTAAELPVQKSERVSSIDAYRGLVMLLMMGEVLEFRRVAKALPGNSFWPFLAYHQSHVAWIGCSLHDLIQPSFSFLVGVALPFSLARRQGEGQSSVWRTVHAFWRALILVLLGVFLRSIDRKMTYWTFEDTLTQIGLGYGFLYVLALCRQRVQWVTLAAILVGYWLMFAVYPLPGADFNWVKAGAPLSGPQHLDGFQGHWGLNTNIAWRFDVWFLNLFPREGVFNCNRGGYATLSFIPTLGTMILGLLAGGVLKSGRSALGKIGWLAVAGVIGLAAGWGLGEIGVCPVVKHIWTPSWVLFSGGWCFLLLAGFYAVMDIWRLRAWAFWLTIVGMNSIAAYLIAHLWVDFIGGALNRHLGSKVFGIGGPAYVPLIHGVMILTIEWLVLWWMWRRKVFLRV